jgi:TRAP-type C4-dicarboxylate transport system permease small subunit
VREEHRENPRAGPAAGPSDGEAERRRSGFDVLVDRFTAWTLGVVASATLFAMMLLTFADVWGRYLLRQPVFGGYEVTEFLMGVLIFSSLPLLCTREGHVTIDILDHLIPKAVMRWQRLVVNLVSAAVLGLMAWRLYLLFGELLRNTEVTMTLKIPHAPFALAFAIMAALACLACLANAWGYLIGTREPRETAS